jgi:hypothetical protein
MDVQANSTAILRTSSRFPQPKQWALHRADRDGARGLCDQILNRLF